MIRQMKVTEDVHHRWWISSGAHDCRETLPKNKGWGEIDRLPNSQDVTPFYDSFLSGGAERVDEKDDYWLKDYSKVHIFGQTQPSKIPIKGLTNPLTTRGDSCHSEIENWDAQPNTETIMYRGPTAACSTIVIYASIKIVKGQNMKPYYTMWWHLYYLEAW